MSQLDAAIVEAVRGAFPGLRDVVRDAVREVLLTTARDDPDRLVSVEQAAGILGLTAGAVRKRAERGQIPCRHIGRRVRFRLGDLLLLGVCQSETHKAGTDE